MTRYALLLRGVNVGTKNSLPMAELRAMLAKLGFNDAQTYVQSGNAVFGTKLSEDALTKGIEHALEDYMGRPIATTLRTLEEVKSIIDGSPFAKVATKPAYLCVTFWSHAPAKAEVAPLQAQEWLINSGKAGADDAQANGQCRHRCGRPRRRYHVFAELGLKLEGRATIEGECSGRVTGLRDQSDAGGGAAFTAFTNAACSSSHGGSPPAARGGMTPDVWTRRAARSGV